MNIDQDSVPSTIEEAVDALIASMTDDELAVIKNSDTIFYHFSAGMTIRNEWSLWEKDNPLTLDAISKYGIAHADDVSGLLFEWTFAKVKGKDFDPVEHCKRYHEHWKAYGTTSLQVAGY